MNDTTFLYIIAGIFGAIPLVLILTMFLGCENLVYPTIVSNCEKLMYPGKAEVEAKLCHSNADCSGYGSRHCDLKTAFCSVDKYCYCAAKVCTGPADCQPQTCRDNDDCDANHYCDSINKMCLSMESGYTTD